MLTTQTGRLTTPLLLISLGLVGLLLNAPQAWTANAQDQEPSYEEELESAKDMLRRYRYEEALKGFKRANEMRDKKSAECFAWMTEAYFGLEAYKNVVDSADKTIALAGGDTRLLVKAYNNKGLALQAAAEKKDQKKLQAAEAAFREALKLQNAPPILRYNLGVVLMQQNRDEEGVAEIKQYIKLQPKGTYTETARKLAENPRRARENYAPDFSFTSTQGEYITLEDLKGKVVVLDFWGTWCPPCVASVPELRNLHKRFSKDAAFVMIAVSSDRDENAWRDFTDKNRMVWPQFRDKEGRIMEAFNIRAFPTYVVIDHEGIVRFQRTGWQAPGVLDDVIKRHIKLATQNVEAR